MKLFLSHVRTRPIDSESGEWRPSTITYYHNIILLTCTQMYTQTGQARNFYLDEKRSGSVLMFPPSLGSADCVLILKPDTMMLMESLS